MNLLTFGAFVIYHMGYTIIVPRALDQNCVINMIQQELMQKDYLKSVLELNPIIYFIVDYIDRWSTINK